MSIVLQPPSGTRPHVADANRVFGRWNGNAVHPDQGEATGRLIDTIPTLSDAVRPTGDGLLFVDPLKGLAEF